MVSSKSTILALILALGSLAWSDEPVARLIEKIRAVGPKGEKHVEAVAAARQLQKTSVENLMQIIEGLDGANPLATNWLRGVAEAIAAGHVKQGGKLPIADLEQHFQNTKHAPRGRRLAYELIASVDPTAEKRMIPPLQTDPSLELRYDAIRLAIDDAAALEKEGKTEDATRHYSAAFENARDIEQTKQLAAKLKQLGRTIDMPSRMGFVTAWHVIGPFKNEGDAGWDVKYAPEKETNFAGKYPGKENNVEWIELATADEYGMVDLNKALGKHKGAIAYAASEFESDREQMVEIRIGCINANKVWVNGELVAANRVYHTGQQIDQYTGQAKLKQGTNVILVKIGQNEQTEAWAQDWKFQLRVCDSLGGPVLSADRK